MTTSESPTSSPSTATIGTVPVGDRFGASPSTTNSYGILCRRRNASILTALGLTCARPLPRREFVRAIGT